MLHFDNQGLEHNYANDASTSLSVDTFDQDLGGKDLLRPAIIPNPQRFLYYRQHRRIFPFQIFINVLPYLF